MSANKTKRTSPTLTQNRENADGRASGDGPVRQAVAKDGAMLHAVDPGPIGRPPASMGFVADGTWPPDRPEVAEMRRRLEAMIALPGPGAGSSGARSIQHSARARHPSRRRRSTASKKAGRAGGVPTPCRDAYLRLQRFEDLYHEMLPDDRDPVPPPPGHLREAFLRSCVLPDLVHAVRRFRANVMHSELHHLWWWSLIDDPPRHPRREEQRGATSQPWKRPGWVDPIPQHDARLIIEPPPLVAQDPLLAIFEFADIMEWAGGRPSLARALLRDTRHEPSFADAAAWPRLTHVIMRCGASKLDRYPGESDALWGQARLELLSRPQIVPQSVYDILDLPAHPLFPMERPGPSSIGDEPWSDAHTLAAWLVDLLFPIEVLAPVQPWLDDDGDDGGAVTNGQGGDWGGAP